MKFPGLENFLATVFELLTLPNQTRNDLMLTAYILGYKIYQLRPLKNVVTFLLWLYVSILFIHVFFFITQPEEVQFIKYGSFFLQMLWAVLCMGLVIFKNNILDDVFKFVEFWTLDYADKPTIKKILKQAKFLHFAVILFTLVGICWMFLLCLTTRNDAENILPILLLEKWFPQHHVLATFLFKSTFIVTVFPMMVPGYIVIFGMQQGKFQLYMFESFILKISSGYEQKDNLIWNACYQELIRSRLKFLINRHSELLSGKTNILKVMSNLIVVYSIGGFAIGLSDALAFFQVSEGVEIWRSIMFTILSSIIFVSLITSGQDLENEFENVFTLFTRAKWYTWTPKNRLIFVVILSNSVRNEKIQFTENIAINNRLGMTICRSVYSAVSLYVNIA